MKRVNFKSFNFWLISLILIYSAYDYLEHILRQGSTFEQSPLDWLFFNMAAIGSLLLLVIGIKQLLEKLFRKSSLLFELVGLGLWLALYIQLLGPLFNRLFWPHDQLFFQFQFSAFFLLLTIYFVIRVMINLILRRNWLK